MEGVGGYNDYDMIWYNDNDTKPEIFKGQLQTGAMAPAAYALLPDKKGISYSKALQEIAKLGEGRLFKGWN